MCRSRRPWARRSHRQRGCPKAWFDFSAGGGGGGGGGAGDRAIADHLRRLGCGELRRRPREVHFAGCTNESYAFHCAHGDFFVKINRSVSAAQMFEGEAEVLKQIQASSTVRVPSPLGSGDLPKGGSYIILEFLAFRPFGMMQESSQAALGHALASLHVAPASINGYGFALPTRLGSLPLVNDWSTSWEQFFIQRRLLDRFEKACQKLGNNAGDMRGTRDRLIARAQECLSQHTVKPSMLHGDLWVGNSGLTNQGVAIFDPAGFFGHSEFDLAFCEWQPTPDFPGFSLAFYNAYHDVIPREPGHEERRQLYQLFHLLNHFLIYGEEYYEHLMAMLRKIL
eukprot:SM000019S05116  [mRNA]  locus=s19:1114713:1117810:+ [translate_table: standard]